MRQSVAITTPVHLEAMRHLLRSDGQEDLCFALWNPSTGSERFTACIQDLILPENGERRVHGNASFLPGYFERAVSRARKENCGLALMHSHPARGWQGMSPDDIHAEESHAGATLGATQLPLVGLTCGTDEAWSARIWHHVAPRRYERQWSESVRIVGDRLWVTYHDKQRPVPAMRNELVRTVSAWGAPAQANLMRLRVGVIGAGSVGAIVAEALARMGVGYIRLLDFDIVENVNLDRLLHATAADARAQRLKVHVLAKHLRLSATAAPFRVDALDLSVVEEAGYRAALDCDVLFSCVDRPWPRFILNLIAFAHLIPVVDGGLLLTPQPQDRGLKRATWRSHVAAPTRRCLECLGQYDPSHVSLERSGQLDLPSYIEGLSKDHALRRNENVFGFSLSVAAQEIEQLLRMTVPHPGHANIGAQTTHFVRGIVENDSRGCDPGCPFCAMVAKGDRSSLTDITGYHHAAENMRQKRRRTPLQQLRSLLGRLFKVAAN